MTQPGRRSRSRVVGRRIGPGHEVPVTDGSWQNVPDLGSCDEALAMVEKSSTASLIVAWTLYAGALGLVACYILVPIVWPSRPTRADLARGEAMIRSRYVDARTRIGHIALAPAGNCAMHGQADFIDASPDGGGTVRRADCLVTISGSNRFTATCR